jgi:predicted metalloprotease with PDZ domain
MMLSAATSAPVAGQQRPAPPAAVSATISAPISSVGYHIAIDSADAAQRRIRVAMTFTVASADPVLLSLPAWTPGAYELSYWAKNVSAFAATSGSKSLAWDKADYQTWRIRPAGAGAVSISFEYRNDSLDNSNSWSQPDFALLNGANLFPYAAGRPFEFASTVELSVPSGWRVATGMTQGARNTFTAPNYHDLVDMPFVAGRFDFDSTRVGDGWLRFASYPASVESVARRTSTLTDLSRIIGVEAAVFGETPWKTYTVMQIADTAFGGIVGLEHQNSHVARDLSRVEREAASAGGHVAVSVRARAADAVAVDERGGHRLLRRSRARAKRRERLERLLRNDRRKNWRDRRASSI